MKPHIKAGWPQLVDLSPKHHYPVFAIASDDKGYRVVNFGSAFAVKTNRGGDSYFLTNKHVVEYGEGLLRECQRFYAGMRYVAQEKAMFGDVDGSFNQLLNVCTLATKPKLSVNEYSLYQLTVESIWDAYDKHLSEKVDPQRVEFAKYLKPLDFKGEVAYFLHAPGSAYNPPLQVEIYKSASDDKQPDLSILSSKTPVKAKLEFDSIACTEGQEIQAIGYPQESVQIDAKSDNFFSPTFTTGRLSRVTPTLLEFDAAVAKGNSGGPVVNKKGKVIGVVVRRATSKEIIGDKLVEAEVPNFAGAIPAKAVRAFAPELFGSAK
jgi:hypothetical protein